ncbi:hypothetical protein FRC97_00230 (plasmid) [Paracidovorax citrulli]|nr:hypothetical protein APS58_p00044 [Paracidovorax citrulli]UMT93563.1 hypothetical protein FRC97_00230 [Paracidovorax citrulli]
MGYINPLLRLDAVQQLLDLPREQRTALARLLRELRSDADRQAENAWRKRKGPMAAYWRAVATYARHTAHALDAGVLRTGSRSGTRLRQEP